MNHLSKTTNLLQALPIFHNVSLASIQHILARCEERKYAAGDILLRPDILHDEMFLILAGRVSVHLDSADSRPLVVLETGECVGEMSLFDGQPPSAFVKAAEPSLMLVIGQAALWEMIDASHDVARNLLRMLSHRIRSSNLTMTELEKQMRQHEQDANLDALTGLRNRRWLENLLMRLQGENLMPYLPLSVVMLDIDHFKQINDTYGHEAGDVALQAVANLLRGNVRPHDMVARYGGEEFIVLLPNTTPHGAGTLAERVRRLVAGHRVSYLDDTLGPITISAGLAACATAVPLEHVIRRADMALYRAKRMGRNCVCRDE